MGSARNLSDFAGDVVFDANGNFTLPDREQIVSVGIRADPTDYSTTSTTSYAAAGNYFEITPTLPGQTKLICVWVTHARASDAGDAGILFRPEWYDGSVYAAIGPTGRMLLATSTTPTFIPESMNTIVFEASSSQRRTDNGDWLLRLFFSSVYSGTTSTLFQSQLHYFEVLE